ncbi:DUF3927 family protein [Citrobacter freundii]|nr:DUF3927 family protein [Citrobacter freundii]
MRRSLNAYDGVLVACVVALLWPLIKSSK